MKENSNINNNDLEERISLLVRLSYKLYKEHKKAGK